MSGKIKIFDTTLRDGEQSPGCSMDLNEKLDMAQQLERLGVDIIEAGFAISSPGDLHSVAEIAKVIKNAQVCSLARTLQGDIDAAYEAVQYAVAPRIHTFLATSPVHMKYKLKMTPEEVIDQAATAVAYAKKYVADVEFSAEDAMRSDKDFLVKVFEAVIAQGATVINIPDTVGYAMPEEMTATVRYLMEHTKGIEKVDVSVHCHNDLGLAVANALAAVRGGANQIECTVNGIGERAGNTSLEEAVMAIHTRPDLFDVHTDIVTPQIFRTSRLLQSIIGVPVPPTKPIIGENAFAHEAGIHQHGVLAERTTYEILTPESVGISQNNIVLGKHSGKRAFQAHLNSLGYELTPEQLNDAFERFKVLADKKRDILDRDLDILIRGEQVEASGRYGLVDFVINSSNITSSMAKIKLSVDDKEIEGVGLGYGPIDASFKAINDLIGRDYELTDYSLRSVTEGEDALGEAMVKMVYRGAAVTGRGVSTDILEASIKAYVNAVNKMKDKRD